MTQLAREFGAYVIGDGRAADRQKALDFGAQGLVDVANDAPRAAWWTMAFDLNPSREAGALPSPG